MNLNDRFTVAQVYGPFFPEVRYHFYGYRDDDDALIIHFTEETKGWRSRSFTINRERFEEGLLAKKFLIDTEHHFPPWLDQVEGTNFDNLEQHRRRSDACNAVSYRTQVEKRLLAIGDAVADRNKILNAGDPLSVLNAYAAETEPPTHPHRFQTQFFSYTIYGNIWALKTATHRCGTWSRTAPQHKQTRFGRVSVNPDTAFTHAVAHMRPRLADLFVKHSKLGQSLKAVYEDSMLELGCMWQETGKGKLRLYHPAAKPFPSIGQFRYAIEKELGVEFLRIRLYGRAHSRAKAVVAVGYFTEDCANILQGLVVDAYFLKERPKRLLADAPGLRIAVARGVCKTTGGIGGVGFSVGGETAEAYRAMLFCMVVKKWYIARIYGIPASHLADWLMEGRPTSWESDRGPPGKADLVESLEFAFPIKRIVPSYQGQSKANIESKHPREKENLEAPSHVQSDSDAIELMKREIYRAHAENTGTDISERLTEKQVADFAREDLPPTPQAFWSYLEERGRSNAVTMSLHDAVRTYWTPVDFDVTEHGVCFHEKTFSSKAFRQSPFLSRLLRGNKKKLVGSVRGYILSAVVRYVWIEIEGRLMEIEACHRLRVDGDEHMIPLSELKAVEQQRKILAAQGREQELAARLRAKFHYKETTGHGWSAGRRRQGPSRKTDDARREASTMHAKRRRSNRRSPKRQA